ncbi:MAG: 30S ribosomal protein S8 [Bdellovibrionales bacterium]|jgi:small subunit ribosomal protein S8
MDKVGQFLTQIRNASLARHDKVDIPASRLRTGIAQLLQESGFIRSFKVAKDSKQGVMRVYLKYDDKGTPAITALSSVSTPGRRVYVHATKIPNVRSGTGTCILSTSQGILTGSEAAKKNVGGELLCTVW